MFSIAKGLHFPNGKTLNDEAKQELFKMFCLSRMGEDGVLLTDKQLWEKNYVSTQVAASLIPSPIWIKKPYKNTSSIHEDYSIETEYINLQATKKFTSEIPSRVMKFIKPNFCEANSTIIALHLYKDYIMDKEHNMKRRNGHILPPMKAMRIVCGFRTYNGKKFDTITKTHMGHCWIEEWTEYGWYVVEATYIGGKPYVARYTRDNFYKTNGINSKTIYGLALFKYTNNNWGIKLYYDNFKKLHCGHCLIEMKKDWNKSILTSEFFDFTIP